MNKTLNLTGFVMLFVLTSSASAGLVYGTSAPLTGSRDASLGQLSISGDTDWNDGVLSWSIANNGNGTYNYSYTMSNFNSPGISHFTLDISDDAVSGSSLADPNAITNATLNGSGGLPLEFGDKDGIVGAVKFDLGNDGTLNYSFTSNRHPVYGHFILKGGSSTTATNLAFGDASSMNSLDYIARPNSAAIPEPSACLLMGLLATGFAGRRLFARLIG